MNKHQMLKILNFCSRGYGLDTPPKPAKQMQNGHLNPAGSPTPHSIPHSNPSLQQVPVPGKPNFKETRQRRD